MSFGTSDAGSLGNIIQYGLVALLVAAGLKSYLGRETSERPKWMGSLMTADAKKALATGLLLILLMPSDVAVLRTVVVNVARNDSSWVAAVRSSPRRR